MIKNTSPVSVVALAELRYSGSYRPHTVRAGRPSVR